MKLLVGCPRFKFSNFEQVGCQIFIGCSLKPLGLPKRSVFSISYVDDCGGEKELSINRICDFQEVLPRLFLGVRVVP
jgi:hypothetical protein